MADDLADSGKEDDRWTVRGVPVRTRTAAADAARRGKVAVGTWLCQAIDAAIEKEREPLDLSRLPSESATSADSADTLDDIERAVMTAIALSKAPDVPAAFRRKANRLLREALPAKPPKLLMAPDK